MKLKKLIELLKDYPEDAEVEIRDQHYYLSPDIIIKHQDNEVYIEVDEELDFELP